MEEKNILEGDTHEGKGTTRPGICFDSERADAFELPYHKLGDVI